MGQHDRIEKRVKLRAPLSRGWRAIADSQEFGRWFGVQLEGPFVAGQSITGRFEEGLNRAAIAEYQKRLGLPPSKVRLPPPNAVFCTVERIDPDHRQVTTVALKTNAKVNLFLRVNGRRPDGYHEVETILHTIGLADEVSLEVTDTGRVEIEMVPGAGLASAMPSPLTVFPLAPSPVKPSLDR